MTCEPAVRAVLGSLLLYVTELQARPPEPPPAMRAEGTRSRVGRPSETQNTQRRPTCFQLLQARFMGTGREPRLKKTQEVGRLIFKDKQGPSRSLVTTTINKLLEKAREGASCPTRDRETLRSQKPRQGSPTRKGTVKNILKIFLAAEQRNVHEEPNAAKGPPPTPAPKRGSVLSRLREKFEQSGCLCSEAGVLPLRKDGRKKKNLQKRRLHRPETRVLCTATMTSTCIRTPLARFLACTAEPRLALNIATVVCRPRSWLSHCAKIRHSDRGRVPEGSKTAGQGQPAGGAPADRLHMALLGGEPAPCPVSPRGREPMVPLLQPACSGQAGAVGGGRMGEPPAGDATQYTWEPGEAGAGAGRAPEVALMVCSSEDETEGVTLGSEGDPLFAVQETFPEQKTVGHIPPLPAPAVQALWRTQSAMEPPQVTVTRPVVYKMPPSPATPKTAEPPQVTATQPDTCKVQPPPATLPKTTKPPHVTATQPDTCKVQPPPATLPKTTKPPQVTATQPDTCKVQPPPATLPKTTKPPQVTAMQPDTCKVQPPPATLPKTTKPPHVTATQPDTCKVQPPPATLPKTTKPPQVTATQPDTCKVQPPPATLPKTTKPPHVTATQPDTCKVQPPPATLPKTTKPPQVTATQPDTCKVQPPPATLPKTAEPPHVTATQPDTCKVQPPPATLPKTTKPPQVTATQPDTCKVQPPPATLPKTTKPPHVTATQPDTCKVQPPPATLPKTMEPPQVTATQPDTCKVQPPPATLPKTTKPPQVTIPSARGTTSVGQDLLAAAPQKCPTQGKETTHSFGAPKELQHPEGMAGEAMSELACEKHQLPTSHDKPIHGGDAPWHHPTASENQRSGDSPLAPGHEQGLPPDRGRPAGISALLEAPLSDRTRSDSPTSMDKKVLCGRELRGPPLRASARPGPQAAGSTGPSLGGYRPASFGKCLKPSTEIPRLVVATGAVESHGTPELGNTVNAVNSEAREQNPVHEGESLAAGALAQATSQPHSSAPAGSWRHLLGAAESGARGGSGHHQAETPESPAAVPLEAAGTPHKNVVAEGEASTVAGGRGAAAAHRSPWGADMTPGPGWAHPTAKSRGAVGSPPLPPENQQAQEDKRVLPKIQGLPRAGAPCRPPSPQAAAEGQWAGRAPPKCPSVQAQPLPASIPRAGVWEGAKVRDRHQPWSGLGMLEDRAMGPTRLDGAPKEGAALCGRKAGSHAAEEGQMWPWRVEGGSGTKVGARGVETGPHHTEKGPEHAREQQAQRAEHLPGGPGAQAGENQEPPPPESLGHLALAQASRMSPHIWAGPPHNSSEAVAVADVSGRSQGAPSASQGGPGAPHEVGRNQRSSSPKPVLGFTVPAPRPGGCQMTRAPTEEGSPHTMEAEKGALAHEHRTRLARFAKYRAQSFGDQRSFDLSFRPTTIRASDTFELPK
ncbi:uncharacterized protein LOC144287659 [Canis aureus]